MRYVTFIFLAVFTLSCTHDFQPKGLDAGGETHVVNGIVYPDSVARIFVGKSSFYKAPGAGQPLPDAEVSIHWEDARGPQTERLVFRDSAFVGNSPMRAGIDYRLEVRTAEGHVLKAETAIPEAVPIGSTKLLYPAGYMDTETIKGAFYRIFVDFEVPEDQTRYFETLIYTKDTSSVPGSELTYGILKTYNNDEVILAEDLPSNFLHAFVFTTSPQGPENLGLAFDVLGGGNPFFSEFYPVLISVSRDYYLYKKSLYEHLGAISFTEFFTIDDLYLPNIFENIAPVHSNIEGGKGIFAGANRSEMKTVCNLVGRSCE